MQKRKGFTLVELVIVIAVIAILAGVLIGTFASVINKANESAKLQEMKAAEHEQKADDLLKKIENSNWYGWEDFETSIVEKMTQVFKANASNTQVSVTEIQKAVKDALAEYAKNNAQANTSLTEEQVKVIVEDAIGKISYNGVTEAQVRAIVATATSSITATQLTASQVKSIVNAAAEKGLTAAQVAQVIGQAGLASNANVTSAVNTITTAIANAAANQLTTEDLAEALIDLLPVTLKVASQPEVNAAVAKLNSFSTLNFTTVFDATIKTDKNITLTVTGVKLENLTVDAPLATIYLITDEGKVRVASTANESLHISGKVDELTVGKGRVVVEEQGEVTALKAAPEKNAVITVAVQPQAKVGTLTIDLQFYTTTSQTFAETVAVENAGTVDTVNVTKNTSGTNEQSTNVTVNNTSSSEGATAGNIAQAAVTAGADVVVTDIAGKAEYTVTAGEVSTQTNVDTTAKLTEITVGETTGYAVRTADELRLVAKLVNSGSATYSSATYILTTDVDVSDQTWTPIGQYKENAFKGSFYGQGYTISGMTNYANYEYQGIPEISGATQKDNLLFGLFNHVAGCTIKDIKLLDVNVKMPYSKDGGGVGGGLVAYANYGISNQTTTISGCKVSGSIEGFDCLGAIVGRANYTQKVNNVTVAESANDTVDISNCVVTATITGHRYDFKADGNKYCRVGAVVGFASCTGGSNCVVSITGCTIADATVLGRAGNVNTPTHTTNNLAVGGASNGTCCSVDSINVVGKTAE